MNKHIQTLPIPLMLPSLVLLFTLILDTACGTGAVVSDPLTSRTGIKPGSDSIAGDMLMPLKGTTGTVMPNVNVGFDCEDVHQIPSNECEALVTLYTSTGGPGWINNIGWLVTFEPCSWFGIECAHGHVSNISLVSNHLDGVLPPELGDLSHLRTLGLSSNRLCGPIPASLGKLNQISELDLSYNQLTGPVPEFIDQISGRILWGNQLDGSITVSGNVPFSIDYKGVHFSVDPSLTKSIWPEVKPATSLPGVLEGPSYWLANPEHISFTFADSSLLPSRRRMGFNLPAEGQILVFPLVELVNINPMVQVQIESLQKLLAQRVTVPSGELPLLPLTNSIQVFSAQAQYLDFNQIQGLRFISQHSQDPAPIILSQELFYTFQGFTADGAHYVAAFFPLTTAFLPDTIEGEDWEAFHANYDTYLSETTSGLDQLPPTEFMPDLSLLDAVVTSLSIETDSELIRDLASCYDSY